ncbi:MAG TPA: GntR family transcriptional regulator [Streptosporangiaceae bacterium]|nr:GntR family transcriptional regulator [Streptosporangiaceae bacterium]
MRTRPHSACNRTETNTWSHTPISWQTRPNVGWKVRDDVSVYSGAGHHRRPAPAAGDGRRVSQRERAYSELRRRVMMGEFGVRTRLVEERLAKELDMSRTPIREALVRLETDRLVVREETSTSRCFAHLGTRRSPTPWRPSTRASGRSGCMTS